MTELPLHVRSNPILRYQFFSKALGIGTNTPFQELAKISHSLIYL